MSPLALLDRMLLAIAPPPPDPVREHLWRLGYTSVAIVDVLCAIERTGSPACESLDAADVAGVVAVLDGECHDDCERCRDEARFRRGLLGEGV